MCGRFALNKNIQEVKSRFQLSEDPDDAIFSFNIAPGQSIGVILNQAPNKLSMVQWGLIPHWAKEKAIGYKMINARSETIAEKSSFKHPFRRQRCLIVADAFYEWKKEGSQKRPYRILLNNEEIFAMAGIWDEWQGLKTCAIITTAANGLISTIHERMPVILSLDQEKGWLGQSSESDLLGMLVPYRENLMKMYEISTVVNSPKNDDAQIIAPVKS